MKGMHITALSPTSCQGIPNSTCSSFSQGVVSRTKVVNELDTLNAPATRVNFP